MTYRESPIREKFTYEQAWSLDENPQEQTMRQNMAEERFDFYHEQAALLCTSVSHIKRSMRMLKDEDDREYMAIYRQQFMCEGTQEAIEQLKAIFDRRLPPIFAELLRR